MSEQKVTADDVRKLRRDVDELQRRDPSKPPVQKVLVTEAFATGLAFGCGFMIAAAILSVAGFLLMALGIVGGSP